MNAQLLTAFSDAPTSKAGKGTLALLTQLVGSKSSVDGELNVSFADLLDQQADSTDPQLLDMLNALGLGHLGQPSRGELLAQLKQLGVSSDQLNELSQYLQHNSKEAKALLADLRQVVTEAKHTPQTPLAAETTRTPQNALVTASISSQPENNTKNSTQTSRDFINSTLFVANESKALRAERFSVSSQAIKATSFNHSDTAKTTALSTEKISTKTALDPTTPGSRSTSVSISTTLLQELTGSQSQNHNSSGNSVLLQLNQPLSQSSPTGPNAFAPMYNAQINTPVLNTTQWGTDFGRVMVQMSQQAHTNGHTGLQTAEIRLDPPELGPMRIMLSINEGVANAMIFAAHAQTRQAVELSLPQLQQQLAQSGLSLGEANVSDQGFFAQSDQHFDQSQAKSSETFSLDGTHQDVGNESLSDENVKQSNDPNAIIDTFA